MEGRGARAHLSVDPALDVDVVFGKRSRFEQLMDAVDGEEARLIGVQVVGDWHLDCVRSNNLKT